MVCLVEIICGDLRISIPASGAQAGLMYPIPWNNSRPSINRLPRIIVPPPTAPLAIFSSFHPLPVKLKYNVIQQN